VALNAQIYKHGREKANEATLFVAGGNIKYRVDGGAPSTTIGIDAFDGDVIELEGFNDIKMFKAIRSGAVDATLACDYGSCNS
jgi:hypothetical protein